MHDKEGALSDLIEQFTLDMTVRSARMNWEMEFNAWEQRCLERRERLVQDILRLFPQDEWREPDD